MPKDFYVIILTYGIKKISSEYKAIDYVYFYKILKKSDSISKKYVASTINIVMLLSVKKLSS